MTRLLIFSRIIDRFSKFMGLAATYLVLAAALVSAFNAVVRYSVNGLIYLAHKLPLFAGELSWIFDVYRDNSNTFVESQWYMFAAMVMLGAAQTLSRNEHVRVDILYGSVGDRFKLWIDLLGGIFFLLPMCISMVYFTWPWFLESFHEGEMSANAGGLLRWPVKLLLPLGFAFLALQGISEIIKCCYSLLTGEPRKREYDRPVQ